MNKRIMMGNEAVARGTYEAGCHVAAGYPGTPSTEILEALSRNAPDVKSQWSPNEKVALEVAFGSALAGARALATMKHVGVNVAADPLFTFSYTGVNGGLVIISADDPGQWSSQNEQDNRNYARHAKVPMLEPSSPDEARRFVKQAFQLSEDYDRPVLVKVPTRIAHSRAIVAEEEVCTRELKRFQRDPQKYVMIPIHGRQRHIVIEEKQTELANVSDHTALNRVEWGDTKQGIVTDSVAYQYVKEVAPEASVLKLGMVWPLPRETIQDFAAGVDGLIVVEELDPFIENEIRAMGIPVAHGKDVIPNCGELTPDIVAQALNKPRAENHIPACPETLPPRPPRLCKGCPHAPIFTALKELDLNVIGDIGCYTLAALAPYNAMHTQACMGASVGMHFGMEKASPQMAENSVAVIGDSTFVHSGITPLIDIVYNQGTGTVIILDNRTTAMTGHQEHPATGVTLSGEATHALDIPKICEATGVQRVFTVDPFEEEDLKGLIQTEVETREPSIIVVNRPCLLK